MSFLELKDVVLEIEGRNVLDHLSIDFWEGHIHAIIGPNGAGKSTLANAIIGLPGYTGFKGDITYLGESLKGMDIDERARRGITLGWQEPARFEGLPVRKFIMAGAKEKTDAKVDESLDRVGLDPARYRNRPADRTLSGGERKRIEVASILAMEPRVVLMDEPDSGIDVEALEKIYDAIRQLKKEGTTVILITHSLDVLQQAEHAFLICNGRIWDKGSVEKIGAYFREKCIPCPHPNVPPEDATPEVSDNEQ